jgi:hypothetical protein
MSQSAATKPFYNPARRDPAVEPGFYEWCETRLEQVLEEDAVQTHLTCWEQEPDRTMSLCLAFRGNSVRPFCLDTFHRMCAVSNDLVDALEKGQIDTQPVIEIALFYPDSARETLPLELRETCDRFRNAILEAAQEWPWVIKTFHQEQADAKERSRCSCRFNGGCVCD